MKTTDELIQTLQSSPYWKERREAALALGRTPKQESRQALIEALDDPDDDVLQAVIVALGKIGDVHSAEQMLLPRYLDHTNSYIRWATLQTIGKIGDDRIVPGIVDKTDDHEWIVRNEALKIIRKQGESLLTKCHYNTVRRMIGLLASDNEDLHQILIEAFLRVGSQIKPYLREFLETGGEQIQASMAYILGRLKDRDSVPLLIKRLDAPDKKIRISAIEALGQIADPSALSALIEKFGDPSREVQQKAAAAVANMGNHALDILHEKIHFSSRKLIQQNVLITLAKIRHESSIPIFVDYLGSTYFVVRRAAIMGLVQFGERAVDAVTKIIQNVQLPMMDELLRQAEHGSTLGIRLRAIRALGALADHRSVHLLKQLCASKEPNIQKASLEALAQIGCSCWQRCGALAVLRELRLAPDIELIIEQLQDDSENVRLRAIQVLARAGNTQAVPALLQSVSHDSNQNLRYAALRAADELSPANPDVIQAALKVLRDPSASTPLAAEAVRVIGRKPEREYLETLLDCLKNTSWEVRRNAALALGNMGDMALPSLMKRLEKGTEMELESLIRAIGNIGNPGMISEIEKIAAPYPPDSPVQFAASKAIRDIRDRDSANS